MRHWSLIHTQKKRIWVGLSEKELLMLVTISKNELEHIFIHREGETQWQNSAAIGYLIEKNKDFLEKLKQPK